MIAECRRARGLTQGELAAAAGVSIGTLRDLEQGWTSQPRWGLVENLAAALGMDARQRAELTRAWRADSPGDSAAADRHGEAAPAPAGVRIEVRIGVLGPLVASTHGVPVALGSPRQRAVLALLALHPDTWVHRDVLVEVLWGGRPPASAVTLVQGYVSRLRRLLDPERRSRGRGGRLASAGTGYQLPSGAARIDLAEFWRLAGLADQAMHGDPGRACGLYGRALRLWRGDVLADVDLLRDHPAVVELTCRHAEVVSRYARVAAAVGAPGLVLTHLRRVCARDPWDERAHAHLMVALAAGGHRAAALRVFENLRLRLARELGVQPGPHLTRARTRILGR
ncbi:MAG TPA: BTAD domain-containing putative transcriptional regulator [Mycobacteriales bacterium]|nr:BTAD domain-containing putative transcriptional regulator [Mycobacteriales bacterium]